MYRIVATNPDGASYVIYDPVGSGPLPVLAPRITEELNEAGSLEFSLVYGHLAFEALHPKQTYFTVTLDGNELFYGRLLSAEPSPLGGQIQCVVAGALSFLQDGEMAPDPKNDDGSYNFRTMTAEAFFRRCISEFNSEINNDPRRMFYVGIVNHPEKNKEREYQINSYTNFNEVIRQNIIDRYGGFLRVRPRAAGGHFIDWVEQYGAEDNAVLSIGQNILSIVNRMEGEDLITAIRPVGKDGLVLSGSGTLDIFPNDLMAKYGKIVRSVQLGAAENESELSSQARALIAAMHKTVPKTSEISMVDLHFADSNNHGVYLGDVFNHIAGLEGERMTVATRNRDCENPQNDSVTLKNAKMLEGSYDISDYKSNRSSGYSTGSDTLSRQTARAGGGAGMAYKYIHETQDRLELATKHISINAEELEIHADMFIETANEFARLSHVTGTLESEIGVIEGTGVIQNSDFITSLAGQFQYDPNNHTVSLISGTEFRITKNGADITVGDRLTQLTDSQARFEGSALWTRRDAITGVVGEFDVITGADGQRSLKIKSGTELKITKNGAEITVGDRITDLTTNMTTVTGSALWTQRNTITGVVGEFEVVTGADGKRKLVVKSGGGINIRRNNVEFGLYDEGNLTGGIMVDKINQNVDGRVIQGTRVNITANQVHVGSTSNVAAWMSSTGQDINDLQGLVADRATIADLNAQKARIDTLNSIAVTTNNLSAKIAALSTITAKALGVTGNVGVNGNLTVAGSISAGSGLTVNNVSVGTAINALQLSLSGNTYTLKKKHINDSSWTDVGTFSRATSLSGAWSGATYKVTASPQGTTNSVTIGIRLSGTTQYTNFTAEAGTSDSGGNFTRRTSTQGYLKETVSGASSYVDVLYGSTSGPAVARIAISATYNAGKTAGRKDGWSAAYGKVSWAAAGTSSTMTIKAPASSESSSPNQQSGTYSVSVDSNYGYIKYGSIVVARVSHNYKYTQSEYDAAVSDARSAGEKSGWNSCVDAVYESQYSSSYYTGTKTKMWEAPQYGAQQRDVLYPYNSVTITRYTPPGKK